MRAVAVQSVKTNLDPSALPIKAERMNGRRMDVAHSPFSYEPLRRAMVPVSITSTAMLRT